MASEAIVFLFSTAITHNFFYSPKPIFIRFVIWWRSFDKLIFWLLIHVEGILFSRRILYFLYQKIKCWRSSWKIALCSGLENQRRLNHNHVLKTVRHCLYFDQCCSELLDRGKKLSKKSHIWHFRFVFLHFVTCVISNNFTEWKQNVEKIQKYFLQK